jgi:hypothetical protein
VVVGARCLGSSGAGLVEGVRVLTAARGAGRKRDGRLVTLAVVSLGQFGEVGAAREVDVVLGEGLSRLQEPGGQRGGHVPLLVGKSTPE